MKNYYEILGISTTADQEAIHHAYRVQARRYHPDIGAGSSPEDFREVTEAYATLSDPSRRYQYDRALSPVTKPEPLIPTREALYVTDITSIGTRPAASLFVLADELFAAFDAYFNSFFER